MRSLPDRLRHAISFEIIALILVVPLGSVVFHVPIHDIGIVSIVSTTIATFWNLGYNFLFDLSLNRFTGNTAKTGLMRIFHAFLFEAGLLFVLMPFIAWYLGTTLWQAFLMDVSFALFYMIYAFAFNWAYDLRYPLPEWKAVAAPE
jgi:uncharacterized membrane protein